MIIISSRHAFTDPDRLRNRGHAFKQIDLTTNKVLSTISSERQLLKQLSGKKVLMLVHGYNNKEPTVYDAYALIEQKVRRHIANQYDLVLGYSWPGGDRGWDWWSSKRRSDAVARRFRRLMEKVADNTKQLDVMSHSLGARIVFKALVNSNRNLLINNYYCTAAAVDNEVLEEGEVFDRALDRIGRLFVFYSSNDGVLATGYRLVEFDNALGLHGPQDQRYVERQSNLYLINCERAVLAHGDYKSSDAIYRYIAKTLSQTPQRLTAL